MTQKLDANGFKLGWSDVGILKMNVYFWSKETKKFQNKASLFWFMTSSNQRIPDFETDESG